MTTLVLASPGYGDDISAQLSTAERELMALDDAFSRFMQTFKESRTFSSWLVAKLNLFGVHPDEVASEAVRVIGQSIEQLHTSFNDACGGFVIDWDVWWSLAKDCEANMNTVTKYNNTYGSVGGTLDVVGGEGKKALGETIEQAKEALPSEGKFWFAVGALVLVLVLILAIKVS